MSSKKHLASPWIAQRAQMRLLPQTFDWREARHWFWPMTLLTVVILLYLAQSSFATTSELEMQRLIKARDTVLRQNARLAAEIADAERPGRMRERAWALGLVEASRSIMLPVALPAIERAPLSPSVMVSDATGWAVWADEFARWMRQAHQQLESMP